MKVINPQIKLIDKINGEEVLKKLEICGRTCWQTEPKTDSAAQFVSKICKRGHTSVLEHVSFTVNIICDRGVSHELVRHRIASYSQESTRYVKYENDDMQFIAPITLKDNPVLYSVWGIACKQSENAYCAMRSNGATPEEARDVLNNSVKTEIKVTMNIRSWINFFELRCDKAAHPHMKEVAIPLLLYMKNLIPVVFDNIPYDQEFFEKYLKDTWESYICKGE